MVKSACDKTGCVGRLADGRAVSLVLDPSAFAEDCLRAAVVVTPLFAPQGCAAPIVVDRASLRTTGAVALKANADGFSMETARAPGEDRPWSPAPKPRWGRAAPAERDDAGPSQYRRIRLTSLPWICTRSGPKIRVS